MSQLYEIIVFTASQKQYADKIVAQIDPKKRISYVLNRENCIIVNKAYYLKNLKILGRDLKQTILVDVFIVNYSGQQNGRNLAAGKLLQNRSVSRKPQR